MAEYVAPMPASQVRMRACNRWCCCCGPGWWPTGTLATQTPRPMHQSRCVMPERAYQRTVVCARFIHGGRSVGRVTSAVDTVASERQRIPSHRRLLAPGPSTPRCSSAILLVMKLLSAFCPFTETKHAKLQLPMRLMEAQIDYETPTQPAHES